MSDLIIDISIGILLFVAVVFGGIGLVGQLLFPDTRSRMFTAVRATMISLGVMVLAVIIYSLFGFLEDGGSEYLPQIIHSLVLLIVMIAGNWMMYRMIRERTSRESACQIPLEPENNNNTQK